MLVTFRFCPSMDLVLIATSATQQHHLYRTVSWNKVATVAANEELVGNDNTQPSKSVACWSPDGRWVSVAENNKVLLYDIELVANRPIGGAFGSNSTEPEHSFEASQSVQALHWAHVGRQHPEVSVETIDQREKNISWM